MIIMYIITDFFNKNVYNCISIYINYFYYICFSPISVLKIIMINSPELNDLAYFYYTKLLSFNLCGRYKAKIILYVIFKKNQLQSITVSIFKNYI